MAVDFTHASPSATTAYTAEFESRVRLGSAQHYAALAVSGSTYVAAYDYASVGLQSGQAFDLGQLSSPPGIEPTVTFEEVESGNVKSAGIYALTEEGITVSLGVKEFNPETMELAIQNGSMDTVNTVERLFRAGGTCTIRNRPLELSAYNVGCYVPAASDMSAGIQGFILTIYGGYISSGFNIGEVMANETNTFELEYTGIAWLQRELGNQLYNILAY